MYRVLVFYKYDYDYIEETFNLLCNAEDYYDSIASEMEYEGNPFSLVVMYLDKMKIKEFKAWR
jgi:hypothetical protein